MCHFCFAFFSWDSKVPGMTFEDMFLQISTKLPSYYIFGLGETEHIYYRHEMNRKTISLFAKDQPPSVSNCF